MHLVQENDYFFDLLLHVHLWENFFIQEIKANLKRGKLTSHTNCN